MLKADAFKNPTTNTSFMFHVEKQYTAVVAHLKFVYCGFQFSKVFCGY